MMMLKELKIGMENVVADPTKKAVEAVAARPETNKESVITGYRLEICTRRGSRNPVKLPLSDENKTETERVSALLKRYDTVSVILKEPIVKPYALISNGNLISGVSIKADSFTIVEPEADEDLLA